MINGFTTKKIAPVAINSLKEALIHIYWYKNDLRSFIYNCLDDPLILSRINWADLKRNIVTQLIDYLVHNERIYQRQLLNLMNEVSRMTDFSHLARLEDGKTKVTNARNAVRALQTQMSGFQELLLEEAEIERRRQETQKRQARSDAVQQAVDSLTREYLDMLQCTDSQTRGYMLENLLRNLFDIFDLDPKASFKVIGEQIDGAFSFDGTDYLLEAKWQRQPVRASDLDSLAGKLSRKLDNTLGLYLAINGYSEDGVSAHSSGRRLMLLLDGSDLMAVLERRIDLVQLLLRKRRAAAQTGNIYTQIQEIIVG